MIPPRGNGSPQLVDGTVAQIHLLLRTALYHLIIIMSAGKRLQNAPYGIDIGAGIHPRCAVFLFGSGVFVCMAGRVGVAVGIAVAQVYELHVVADTGDEDVAGFQVEVHNLVAVQITDHTEQLLQKTVGLLALGEIVGMMLGKLAERLTVDIFHQNAVGGLGGVAHQMGMLQRVAQLKLLLKGGRILGMGAQLGLQPFQKVELAVQLHTVALARRAAHLQQLCIGKTLLYF